MCLFACLVETIHYVLKEFVRMKYFIDNVKSNWKSGITVSLISLPLAVMLAVASGATPVQGVITALWAGLVAAIVGGSNYNIIGPTGALSGLLASYALLYGAQVLPTLAIMSGLLLFGAYWFKLERYLVFIPSNTVTGFVLGVALIIIFNQTNFACGINPGIVHESFIANLIESFKNIALLNWVSVTVCAASIGLFWVCLKLFSGIPPALIISPIGIVFGYACHNGYVPLHIDILESKFASLSPVLWNPVQLVLIPQLIVPAFAIALIALIETMVSARIADQMTQTKHDGPQEVMGLSLANIASGFAGGIPATAALARTSLNIKSGCTHKMSSAICSISTGVISLVLLGFFRYMPLAIIAALLIIVGFNMIEIEHFKKIFAASKSQFAIALGVAFITVVFDPIVGILVGASVSMLAMMHAMTEAHVVVKSPIALTDHEELLDADTLVYEIRGHLAYINAQAHMARFEKDMPRHKNIVIDMRSVCFIDADGIQVCHDIVALLKKHDKSVKVLTGTRGGSTLEHA